jgi:hypothetical protein
MFCRGGRFCRTRFCALVLAFVAVSACALHLAAQDILANGGAVPAPYGPPPMDGNPYGGPDGQPMYETLPPSSAWIAPPGAQPQVINPVPVTPYTNVDPGWGQPVLADAPGEPWSWHVMPRSIIYHSYQAGVHEPRLGIVSERELSQGQSFWDGTLGARVGLLRYGTSDGMLPQGFELDVEAAAMVRLTLDSLGDFETADYRYGVPLTYGIDNWQFKVAAYHLSSHLGDEFIIENPSSINDRINYVRNEAVLGASYFPEPWMRLYGEVGYSFHCDGGSEPWEVQFGTELSRPGPTGPNGSPFLAINGNLRQEVDWGGDLSTQAGWLWRNETGQVMRLGLHYYNGKSSQYETFNKFEQQVGFGLWYDF